MPGEDNPARFGSETGPARAGLPTSSISPGSAGTFSLEQIARARQVYAALGDERIRALVEAFYRRVEADPLLRPIFPPDLSEGRERQYYFLRQYFGGPAEYGERYGHPQLRQRHLPFRITREARDAWVSHMLAAIDEVGIPEPHAGVMREYFEQFSFAMINQPR